MEARIRQFREFVDNPWFNVMNWVLDELRTPPKYRRSQAANTSCFQVPKLPRTTFMNRPLKL